MIMTFKEAVEGKERFIVVHQRRVPTDDNTVRWESKIQSVEVTKDIVTMFEKVHMTANDLVASSDWFYPNDVKYRFSLQVSV
jgi:hypothetical protein